MVGGVGGGGGGGGGQIEVVNILHVETSLLHHLGQSSVFCNCPNEPVTTTPTPT